MTRAARRASRLVPAVVLLLATGLAAGCGDSEAPPGERVPVLADRLDRVDAAIAAGRYGEARAAVESLVGETAQAQVAGDLDADEAQRILDAAGVLLERLPEAGDPEPEPAEPEPEVPVVPQVPGSEEPAEDEVEPDEDEKDEDEGNGGGNGPSSGNGPDDGHGS